MHSVRRRQTRSGRHKDSADHQCERSSPEGVLLSPDCDRGRAQRHRGERHFQQPAHGISDRDGAASRVKPELRCAYRVGQPCDCALGQNGTSDSDHEINIFNAVGSVDVVADLEGYFAPQSAASPIGEFHPIAPLRVCDTRAHLAANPCNGNGGNVSDNTIGAGGVLKGEPRRGDQFGRLDTWGWNGGRGCPQPHSSVGERGQAPYVFPTDAHGGCTIPGGGTAPHFSTLNVSDHIALANRVMVPTGPDSAGGNDSAVCVYNALGNINVVIDANGWYGSASALMGKQYQAIGPSRICDTRAGSGTLCAGHMLTPGGVETIAVAGVGGVPSLGAVAVIAKLHLR